ncbi:D-alanyl-D-alanine carboxypeptidase family protein [Segniliparus rugosus]|uniref:D-alanyl-D-alanine carboxypeptidase family protein n=1 Tax=Segniliparus rugosus TaxID=286804 RepID=UPI0012EC82DD|nr:serine hydrolase [Segniliparus rugosus]
MPRTSLQSLTAASLAMLAATTVAPLSWADPDDSHNAACAQRVTPPPAVDASEAPQPGHPELPPLPVPSPPIGGELLAACGVVQPAGSPALPEGPARGWLVADLDSGQVLAASDPHGRFRPASTIKTLLALAVLDELDPNHVVQLTDGDQTADEESQHPFIEPGGKYTVFELLEGALMVSSNGAANALARVLGAGGGVEAAVKKMNDLAGLLGAKDTRATTPSGVEAPGGPSTSSPYDLALIFRAAMKQDIFRKIVSQKSITMHGDPDDFPLVNDNAMLDDYPGMLGGKTGFTEDSQKTFVAAAERDGRRLVVTQMYGLNGATTFREQASALLDWGFALDPALGVGKLVNPAPKPVPPAPVPAAQQASSSSGATTTLLLVGILAGGLVLANREVQRRKDHTPTHA